jgi:hypothetical protein
MPKHEAVLQEAQDQTRVDRMKYSDTLTKKEIDRIKAHIEWGDSIYHPDAGFDIRQNNDPDRWISHGYRFYFYFHPKAGEWEITAGCRTWRSFEDFRHHYKWSWIESAMRRYECSEARACQYQKDTLEICKSMEAFAKEFDIKLGGRDGGYKQTQS